MSKTKQFKQGFTETVPTVCFESVVLFYAADIVLLAPSWRGLQHLRDVLLIQTSLIDLSCNIKKTVCMSFMPKKEIACTGLHFHVLDLV